MANFDRVIEINPQDAEAYNNRGNTYSHLKQYEQAITNYGQAIESEPQFALAYYNRGLTYTLLENFPQARENWEQAATLFQQQNNPQGYQAVREKLNQLSQIEGQQ